MKSRNKTNISEIYTYVPLLMNVLTELNVRLLQHLDHNLCVRRESQDSTRQLTDIKTHAANQTLHCDGNVLFVQGGGNVVSSA